MQTITNETYRFINDAIVALEENQAIPHRLHNLLYRPWWSRSYLQSVSNAQEFVLELEQAAKNFDPEGQLTTEHSSSGSDARYPTYQDVLSVLPLFKQAIVLECHRPLVKPTQIPALLFILKIPGFGEGVDIENHGFGYHFHYGRVKSDAVVRTNLLLTFDQGKSVARRTKATARIFPPLYGEHHAEGKNKVINMASIGQNKRLPIYSVCLHVAEKRGLQNFKRRGNDAVVFHSGELGA